MAYEKLTSVFVILVFVSVCNATYFNSSIFCSNSPCQNGGIYTNVSGTCTCVCPWSYYNSTNCTSLNPCWLSNYVCLNGGTRVISADRSSCSCSCPTGYSGTYCQTKTQCSQTCLNNGTAYKVSGFCKCLCPSCYRGDYCQLYDPCMVGCGTISYISGCGFFGYGQISANKCVCRCLPLFTGTYCNETSV